MCIVQHLTPTPPISNIPSPEIENKIIEQHHGFQFNTPQSTQRTTNQQTSRQPTVTENLTTNQATSRKLRFSWTCKKRPDKVG